MANYGQMSEQCLIKDMFVYTLSLEIYLSVELSAEFSRICLMMACFNLKEPQFLLGTHTH